MIFSAAKDTIPSVWYSQTGQRIGNYSVPNGVVWSIDADYSTTTVIGAGSEALFIWDAETGKLISRVETKNATRSCSFSFSGKQVLYTTDNTMSVNPKLVIIDINDPSHLHGDDAAFKFELEKKEKPTCSLWGPLDRTFVTGNESGTLIKWDIRNPGEQLVVSSQAHSSALTDLQASQDCTMFITASKDRTAKLFDMETLDKLKTYQTDRPVNSAAISPVREHVVVGGGQEAMEVTTTATQSGKFEARFFHMIYEEEFARVKGHFGPINSLAFHPDGYGYASGGEDGYVRVHRFDSKYIDFDM